MTGAAVVVWAGLTVAVALVAAAVEWTAERVHRLTGGAARWWEAQPTGTAVDPQAVEMAVASVRGPTELRTPVVAVARTGNTDGRARLLFGCTRAAPGVAADLARSLGLELGEQVTREFLPQSARWWQAARAPETPSEEGEHHWSERMHRQPPEERSALFADTVESMLRSPDDALVVAWRTEREVGWLEAAAWGTSQQMVGVWQGHASTEHAAMRVAPPPVGVTGTVARLLAVLTAGAAGWWVGLGAPGSFGVHRVAGVAVCVTVAVWSTVRLWGLLNVRPAVRMLHAHRLRLPNVDGVGHVPAWKAGEWVSGGSTSAVTAASRIAPDVMTVESGVPIGVDSSGRRCWLSDMDRQWGVILFGDPGSGKTTAALNVLAGDCASIASGSVRRWVLWIETKGEGAARAERVARDAGADPVVLNLSDATGMRLELVDRSDPKYAGRLLSEAMRYAYDDGDIHVHTAEVLAAAFRAAAAVPDQVAAAAGVGVPVNLVEAAYGLLGGDRTTPGVRQRWKAIEGAVPREHRADLLRYTGPQVQAFRRDQQLESPINKLQGLLGAVGVFQAAGRLYTTFDALLGDSEPRVVLLNVRPPSGGEVMAGYTEQTAQRVAAMTMYVLWDAIKRCCDQWQQRNQSVAIYSDELRDIAGFGGAGAIDVVRALADQGRSRGVMPVFATQRPKQLSDRTREAVMSFGSRGYFRLEHHDEAVTAAADLEDTYGPNELRGLPVGHCALRTRRDGAAQPAFTLRPENL